MNKDWKFCPYCGNPVDDCECETADERLPRTYAEVEYDGFENAEAISGARFDDMNYQHYMER